MGWSEQGPELDGTRLSQKWFYPRGIRDRKKTGFGGNRKKPSVYEAREGCEIRVEVEDWCEVGV